MARIISVATANAQTEPVNDAEGADDQRRPHHPRQKLLSNYPTFCQQSRARAQQREAIFEAPAQRVPTITHTHER